MYNGWNGCSWMNSIQTMLIVMLVTTVVMMSETMLTSMEHKHNNLMSSHWQRIMIKWSNVYSCALKFMRQKNYGKWKLISIDCECFVSFRLWYLMMILGASWYGCYWFDILTSCNLTCFLINWLKLLKKLMGIHHNIFLYPFNICEGYIF